MRLWIPKNKVQGKYRVRICDKKYDCVELASHKSKVEAIIQAEPIIKELGLEDLWIFEKKYPDKKECKICGAVKPIEEFPKKLHGKRIYAQPYCRQCKGAYDSIYNSSDEINKELHRARSLLHYLKNKRSINKRRRERYAEKKKAAQDVS